MIPEYSKAALGLHPLIPAYAVDCDENRALCAEQVCLHPFELSSAGPLTLS
jgi:hypothetical protein